MSATIALQQTFTNTKASLLTLLDAIKELEMEVLAADPIDPDVPCGYVPTPKALAYLAQQPILSEVEGLAGGSLPSSPRDNDEGGVSSFQTPPPDATRGAGQRRPQ